MHTFNIDQFIDAYVEAIYFTDTGDEGQPSEDLKLHQSSVESVAADCNLFADTYKALIAQAVEAYGAREDHLPSELLGHDFWLTRNGHGAGFWDRKELEDNDLGKKLTEASRTFPAKSAVDDGEFIYVE